MALFDSVMSGLSPAAALRRGIRQFEQGNVKGAFVLLSRAARSGIPEAEFRVGRCYMEGTGVPPSRGDGVRWVERAATNGYVEAQALLATLCLHGMGPGFADAGPNSGAGLFGGQALAEPDYPSAAKWARRAAEGGSAEGQAVLGFILTSGPEDLRNLSEGDSWYQKSAAGGCPQGQLGYALVLARDTTDS
jgi:TPR repeat protein